MRDLILADPLLVAQILSIENSPVCLCNKFQCRKIILQVRTCKYALKVRTPMRDADSTNTAKQATLFGRS